MAIVSMSDWVAIAIAAANVVGIPIARMVYNAIASRLDKAEALAKAAAELTATCRTEHLAALAAYKLHVAETYASNGYLQEVEKRLVTALDRLEVKIDRLGAHAPGD